MHGVLYWLKTFGASLKQLPKWLTWRLLLQIEFVLFSKINYVVNQNNKHGIPCWWANFKWGKGAGRGVANPNASRAWQVNEWGRLSGNGERWGLQQTVRVQAPLQREPVVPSLNLRFLCESYWYVKLDPGSNIFEHCGFKRRWSGWEGTPDCSCQIETGGLKDSCHQMQVLPSLVQWEQFALTLTRW